MSEHETVPRARATCTVVDTYGEELKSLRRIVARVPFSGSFGLLRQYPLCFSRSTALVFGCLLGFPLGYEFLQGRYGWAFTDRYAIGSYYPFDDVPFVLRCWPSWHNGYDVASAKRRLWIVNEVMFRIGEPLVDDVVPHLPSSANLGRFIHESS